MYKESQQFGDIVQEHCGDPRCIVEVGVFLPADSKVIFFMDDPKCSVILLEPQLVCCNELMTEFGWRPNVSIHRVAIMPEFGEVVLRIPEAVRSNPQAGASAYVEGVDSPFLHRDSSEKIREEHVPAIPFDHCDPGNIDALCVDAEGAEWYVLQNMESRPKIISLEMGGPYGYTNPHYDEIEAWVRDNGYEELCSTQEVILGRGGVGREVFSADIIYIRK